MCDWELSSGSGPNWVKSDGNPIGDIIAFRFVLNKSALSALYSTIKSQDSIWSEKLISMMTFNTISN